MGTINKLGILYNGELDRARDCAARIAERHGGGRECWQMSSLEARGRIAELKDSDMVLTLGGDGTLLKAIQLFSPHGTPILGINAGNLGFLMELPLEGAEEHVAHFLEGGGHIDERRLLEVTAGSRQWLALNECWIHRGKAPKVIEMELSIDGAEFGKYKGDGMLAATATGSTGYAASLGGPVLDVSSGCYLVQPIAVHAGISRALVVEGGSALQIKVTSAQEPAVLYVDGAEEGAVAPGDALQVRMARHAARLLRRHGADQRWGHLGQRLGRNSG